MHRVPTGASWLPRVKKTSTPAGFLPAIVMRKENTLCDNGLNCIIISGCNTLRVIPHNDCSGAELAIAEVEAVVSGFSFAELSDSWGPWYGAPFERLDDECAHLRDHAIRALKLWFEFSSRYSASQDPRWDSARERAFRLMWHYASLWAARRREVADRFQIQIH